MAKFNRRTYSARQFKKELFAIAKQAPLLAKAVGGLSPALQQKLPAQVRGLDPALRERIMLTVTGVNDCHYCEFVHSRVGRVVGVHQEEITDILAGIFDSTPTNDRPALEFAKIWAENSGEVDSETKAKLVEVYGAAKADQIEMTCRVIRLSNLFGNTFDSLLFKASAGNLGA